MSPVPTHGPGRPSRLRNLFEGFWQIGEALGAFLVPGVVFFLVLAGTIQATASRPGGVLGGPIGGVVSFGLHALWGVSAAIFFLGQWVSVVVSLLGVLGALRGRLPWFAGPAGLLAALVFFGLDVGRENVADWLGSATASDAAPFWGALAGTFVGMGSRVPAWVREIWLWSNVRADGTLAVPYRRRLTLMHGALIGGDNHEGFGKAIISMVDGALFFGLGLVGWKMFGFAGVIGAVVIAGTLWNFARALLWLLGGLVVSVFVILPLAALLALWQPYFEDPDAGQEAAEVLGTIQN